MFKYCPYLRQYCILKMLCRVSWVYGQRSSAPRCRSHRTLYVIAVTRRSIGNKNARRANIRRPASRQRSKQKPISFPIEPPRADRTTALTNCRPNELADWRTALLRCCQTEELPNQRLIGLLMWLTDYHTEGTHFVLDRLGYRWLPGIYGENYFNQRT